MNVITDFLLTFSHLEEAEDIVDHLNCFLKPKVALAPPDAFHGNSEFGANVVLGSFMYLDQASFIAGSGMKKDFQKFSNRSQKWKPNPFKQ